MTSLSTAADVDRSATTGELEIPHACAPSSGPSTTAELPTTGPSRLVGLDVARGLALIGMMAVHILPSVGPEGEMSIPWMLTVGKAAALFAVLAGVGIAFASGRRRPPTGRRRDAAAASLVVRAVIIGAVGLLLGYVVPADSAGIILTYYALLFLLAVPLLALSTRALVVLATAITLLMPVLSHLLRGQLPVPTPSNPTFSDLLTDPVGLTTELAVTGSYPALPWLAYLCVGLAVGRANLSSRGVVAKIGALGIGLAVAATAGSWFVMNVAGGWRAVEAAALRTMSPAEYTDLVIWGADGTLPTSTPWWLGTMTPHSSTPFDLAFTIGTSLAVIAAAVLLGRVASRASVVLAAAGSMTLTLYTAHLLMLSSPLQRVNEGVSFAVQLVAVIVFALLWSRRFSRGPLEAAVRAATGRVSRFVLTARDPEPGEHRPVGGR